MCTSLALQVTARAKYSIAHGATFPDLYLPNCENKNVTSATGGSANTTSSAHHYKKPWKLYMANAYHPLLLQQHQENLHGAKRDVANAIAVSLPGLNIMLSYNLINFSKRFFLVDKADIIFFQPICFFLSSCSHAIVVLLHYCRSSEGGKYMDKTLQTKIYWHHTSMP
jgi:hypothetical protein